MAQYSLTLHLRGDDMAFTVDAPFKLTPEELEIAVAEVARRTGAVRVDVIEEITDPATAAGWAEEDAELLAAAGSPCERADKE